MAIALIQSAKDTSGASTVPSLAEPFVSNVTAGSLLVCCVACGYTGGTNPVSGVADNVNGAWTLDGPYQVGSNVGYGTIVYSFANAGAGATTVTVTNGTNTELSIVIMEFSGAATSTPKDASAVYDPGILISSPGTANISTTQASDLIVVSGIVYDNTHTISAGANYTLAQTQGIAGAANMAGLYQLDAGATNASEAVNIAWDNGNGIPVFTAVAYKIAAAGGVSSFSKPMWPMSYF